MEAENSMENALPPGAGEVNHQASSRRRGVATSARSKREGQGPGDSGRERERKRHAGAIRREQEQGRDPRKNALANKCLPEFGHTCQLISAADSSAPVSGLQASHQRTSSEVKFVPCRHPQHSRPDQIAVSGGFN